MKPLFQNNSAYKPAYNYGALLAVFIGLFILSACGGGAGTPAVAVDDTICAATPFAEGCEASEPAQVMRKTIVETCRETLQDDGTCGDSVPEVRGYVPDRPV